MKKVTHMHSQASAGSTFMAFRRTLAVASLAFTAACATTSQVKPTSVASAAPAPEAQAPAPAPVPETKKERDAREIFAQAVAAFHAGDYAKAKGLIDRLGVLRPEVKRVLDRLGDVPVDIEPRFPTAERLERELTGA